MCFSNQVARRVVDDEKQEVQLQCLPKHWKTFNGLHGLFSKEKLYINIE
jgi:hypothetical protein